MTETIRRQRMIRVTPVAISFTTDGDPNTATFFRATMDGTKHRAWGKTLREAMVNLLNKTEDQ